MKTEPPTPDCEVEERSVLLVEMDDEGDTNRENTSEVLIQRGPASVRVIMDPHGENHDVLIEQHAKKWVVFVHPSEGDPVCYIELELHKAAVFNLDGAELTKVEF